MTDLYLDPKDIWTPNIEIVNLAQKMRDQSEFDFSASNLLRVTYSGKVYWKQFLRPILFCEIKLDNYPIGHQNCPLKLASVGRGTVNFTEILKICP